MTLKPLNWLEVPDGYMGFPRFRSAAEEYRIVRSRVWTLFLSYEQGEDALGTFPTLKEAKAAAFAHYSARIMEAFE